MINLIGWLFAGLFIGAVARLLLPGRQPMGCLMTSFCGIAGALIAGLIMWQVRGLPEEPFSVYAWPGYLISIVATMILIGLAYRGRRF